MKAHNIYSIKNFYSLILLLLHNLIYCASEDPIYGKNGWWYLQVMKPH